MKIKTLYFNPLRECCYILWSEPSRECVILDPGCYDRGEFSRLERFVTEEKLQPVRILLTHGHFDHIFGLSWARERWDVPVLMHPDDGYQIKISAKKSFAGAKNFYIKDPVETKKVITGLKSDTTYYVKVRTYTKITVGGKEKKLYSAWSDVVECTTK